MKILYRHLLGRSQFIFEQTKKLTLESLQIKEHQINLFVDVCQSKGLNELYKRNEIVIKNFLIKQAKHFNLLQNK